MKPMPGEMETEERGLWEENLCIVEALGPEKASELLWDLYFATKAKDYTRTQEILFNAMNRAWEQFKSGE
jgi:hypothetical protein